MISLAAGGSSLILASTPFSQGAVPSHPQAKWARLGVPSQDRTGHVVFVGTFAEGNATRSGVFAQDANGDLQLVLDSTQQIGGSSFSTFPAAVAGDGCGVAFLAKLSKSAKTVLLWDDQTGSGARSIASTGSATGGSEPAKLASFTALALPSSPGAPLFTGRLTGANPVCAWGVDSTGTVRLIARQGGTLMVDSVPKTIKTLRMLAFIANSPTQLRSYDSSGQAIFGVTFTDHTQAVVRGLLP